MRFSILLLILAMASAFGQYRTETWELKPGWTAIYLNIDTGKRTLDTLMAGNPDVTDVWQWRPNGLDPSLSRPSQVSGADEWKVWRRGDPANSTFSIPAPHAAYLVRIKSTAKVQNLSLKGKVVLPSVKWRTDGINLVGFPTKSGTTVQLNRYLSGGDVVDDNTEVYRYVGGELDANNPVQSPVRTINAKRGEAFWIRSDKYADFYGPIQVRVALDNGLNFGKEGVEKRVVLTNRTNREVEVTLNVLPSEAAPGSTTTPTVPSLTLRTQNDQGSYQYLPLGGSHVVTVPAKESVGLTLGIDRTIEGTEFAGLLSVTDSSSNYSEIFLPITAEKGSLAGLWLGEARISRVQNQIQRFQRDEDGVYVIGEDGKHVPEVVRDSEGEPVLDGEGNPIPFTNEALNETAQIFKLLLLIHVDQAGKATLLSKVHVGVISDDKAGNRLVGIAREEETIHPDYREIAVRRSSSHFPGGFSYSMTGEFVPGGMAAANVRLGYMDPTNPFLHTYHPDHDNLDSRFEDDLPEGIESHTVDRAITMTLNSASGPGEGPQWGTTLLSGTYAETITGIHKKPIAVSGIFAIGKISDIDVLQPSLSASKNSTQSK